jgi:hypothetical protein
MNLTSKSELLSLPVREWDIESTYDSLLILPTGEEHTASGWGLMTIIGVIDRKPIEIAAIGVDDIAWHLPPAEYEGKSQMSMDCCLESGALHFWYPGTANSKATFTVSSSLSSVDIKVNHISQTI